MKSLRTFSVVVFLTLINLTTAFGQKCGTERWSVKTGGDPDASNVNLNSPQTAAIVDLIALQNTQPEARQAPTEDTVFVVNATLTDYKIESDSDYHLVLMDDQGNTMVAEIPLPSCVDPSSPFLNQITNARQEFDAQFQASSSFQTANVPVQVTGVGFFDFNHGQRGVAPNVIELHPILDIQFNPAAPANDFALASPTTAMHLHASSNSAASVSLKGVNGNAPADVHYAVSGLPAGITSQVVPGANGKTEIRLTASSIVPVGTYPVTVSASSKGRVRSHTIALHVSGEQEVVAAENEKWAYRVVNAASENEILSQANKLGTQGWQMVSVLRTTGSPGWSAFFRKLTMD